MFGVDNPNRWETKLIRSKIRTRRGFLGYYIKQENLMISYQYKWKDHHNRVIFGCDVSICTLYLVILMID